MNLLCDLGWHRPGGLPRWNDGFYFARCRRCGCDLVRTAYQKWHVPDGYRIVWSAEPPSERPDIDLIPVAPAEPPRSAGRPIAGQSRTTPCEPAPAVPLAEPAVAESAAEVPRESAVQAPVETLVEAAPVVVEPPPSELEEAPAVSSGSATPADPPRSARLPISEVLDRLKAEDAGEAPAPFAIPTPRPPPPATPGWSEDFMKDDPADEIVIGPRFPSSGASAFRSEPPWADAEEDGHEPYWAAPSRRLSATASAIAERVRQIGERPAQPWQVIGAAALISALVGVGVMVANPAPPVTDSHAFTSDPVPARPGLPAASAGSAGSSDGASSPSAQPPGNEGIVTASVLSCRSAPSKSARRVRNMMKGQRAEIVGHAGDWVALARRSTQCWAQARFVTTVARD